MVVIGKSILLFLTLALLISFATTNAVLFTPALPQLAQLFSVSIHTMEATFIWFLAGYCLGQLLYSPLNNRFGRKKALLLGIMLQIVSSIMALMAGYFTAFTILIMSRFLLALGSGVGLMMTFTIVSEYYEKKRVQHIIACLIPAFGVVPALGILISGYLSQQYGWSANFYLAIVYGLVMFILCCALPRASGKLDLDAFNLRHMIKLFRQQLYAKALIIGGILMGCCVAFVYIFAALAPFITATYFQFTGVEYAIANGFSSLGLVIGALVSAHGISSLSTLKGIALGCILITAGSFIIFLSEYFILSASISFFIPLFLINLGSSFVLSHASARALDAAQNKADASAVMSFINVGTTTLIMLLFSHLSLYHYLLAVTFISISALMLIMLWLLKCSTE